MSTTTNDFSELESAIGSELPESSVDFLVEFTYVTLRYIFLCYSNNTNQYIAPALMRLQQALSKLSERTRSDLVSTAVEEIFGTSSWRIDVFNFLLPTLPTDGIASAQQAIDGLTKIKDGQSYFAGKYKLRELLYKEVTADYVCYFVEIEGQNAVLEVIRDSLLLSGNFLNFDAWENYLDQLSGANTISLIQAAKLDNGNCFAVYSIPEGYRTIEDWFGFEGGPFRNLREYFEIILGINQAVERTKRGTFFFTNVNSRFIACGGDRHIKLVAIGAALLATPRFLSGHSQKPSSHDEFGFPAYCKFLGWLLFEIASGVCPVEEAEKVQRNVQIKYLSNSQLLDKYQSHLRAFLKRATHKESEFRYDSFTPIADDLRHIIKFLSLYESENIQKLTAGDQQRIELVDYICLRFKASLRNPKLDQATWNGSLDRRLQSLSSDFTMFMRSKGHDLQWYRTWMSEANFVHIRLPKDIWIWLSPSSKHLLKVAIAWKGSVQEALKICNLPEVSDLGTLIFIYMMAKVVYIEVAASVQALGRLANSKVTINAEDLKSLLTEENIRWALTVPANPRDSTKLQHSVEDVLAITAAIKRSQDLDSQFNGLDVLTTWQSLATFIAILGQCLTIYDLEGNIRLSTTNSNGNIPNTKAPPVHLSLALALVDFDHFMKGILERNFSVDEHGLLKSFSQLLSKVKQSQRILTISRIRGLITSYSFAPYGSRYGSLSYNRYLGKVERKFFEDDLPDRKDIARSLSVDYPARIDLIKKDFRKPQNDILLNVLTRSMFLFPILVPERPAWQVRFRSKSKIIKKVILAFAMFVAVMLAISLNGIVAGLVNATIALIAGILTNSISNVIYDSIRIRILSADADR